MTDGEYQVSCTQFTVWLNIQGTAIVDSAPIVRKFIGQPVTNLIQWCQQKRWGPIKIHKLKVQVLAQGDE